MSILESDVLRRGISADDLERAIEQAQADGCEFCESEDVTVGDEVLWSRGEPYIVVGCNACGRRGRRWM